MSPPPYLLAQDEGRLREAALRRRELLAGGLAAGVLSILPVTDALASGSARREFRILRGGSDIGRHVLEASLSEGRFEMSIDVDIRVTLLGITAYRYTLANREVWSGGQIVSIDSQTNDDGDKAHARIRRAGDGLEVDGSGYSGPAPGDAVTTSYYARPFIDRRPWLSTQSGRPLDISVAPAPQERLDAWKVKGDLETRLIYDERAEWVGCVFDANGTEARYEVIDEQGRITALWKQA